MSSTTRAEYRDRQYSRMLLGLGSWLALGCGVAIGAVFGDAVRLAVWIVLETFVLVAARRNALDVVVNDSGIAVGRARLPWDAVERVEILTGDAFRSALTVDGHPNDYRQIRSTKAGLRAWVSDPTDPHRAWVVSVREPEQLRAALAVPA